MLTTRAKTCWRTFYNIYSHLGSTNKLLGAVSSFLPSFRGWIIYFQKGMPFIEKNKQPAYVGGDISYKQLKGFLHLPHYLTVRLFLNHCQSSPIGQNSCYVGSNGFNLCFVSQNVDHKHPSIFKPCYWLVSSHKWLLIIGRWRSRPFSCQVKSVIFCNIYFPK